MGLPALHALTMRKEDVLNSVRQGASDNEELSKLLHLVNTCPKPEIWDGLQAAEVLGVLRVALQKDTAGTNSTCQVYTVPVCCWLVFMQVSHFLRYATPGSLFFKSTPEFLKTSSVPELACISASWSLEQAYGAGVMCSASISAAPVTCLQLASACAFAWP